MGTAPGLLPFGLTDFFQWQQFLIPYFTKDTTKTEEIQQAWGADFDMDTFVDGMRSVLEKKVFGSAYADISVNDMFVGYKTDVADKVNGGTFINGDDFNLSPNCTVLTNNQIGYGSQVEYGMYTGSNGVDEIGQLRIIDGQAYANRKVALWNSTNFVNITIQSPFGSFKEKELDDVAAGMQFPPGVETDDQIRIYN